MKRIARLALVAAAAASPAHAVLPVPLGDQQIANIATLGIQNEVAVAVDPLGNFFVVWRDELRDGDLSAIVGRRFSSRTGLPLSNEIVINVSTTGDQRNPAVAMAHDGSFVVVWEGPDTPLPAITPGIFGSLRGADGTPIEAEFAVNTTTAGLQRRPAVAMQPGGGFLVVWQSGPGLDLGGPAPEGEILADEEIVGRLFPPTFPDTPPSPEIPMNVTYTAGDQERPAVAAGAFFGVWYVAWEGPYDEILEAAEAPFSVPSIFFRWLNGAGIGPGEVLLNTSLGPALRSRVALAADDIFAVGVWQAPDADRNGIYGRLIGKLQPFGTEFPINDQTEGDQREPSVAMDQRAGFVTAWVTAQTLPLGLPEPEGSPIVIKGKKSSSGGGSGAPEVGSPATEAAWSGEAAAGAEPEGGLFPDPEFQVNSGGSGFVEPWVASEPSGNFVVAWEGSDALDPDGSGVFFRRFADGIFVDGFESENVCAWSAAVGGDPCP
jgi:hypothetical protein